MCRAAWVIIVEFDPARADRRDVGGIDESASRTKVTADPPSTTEGSTSVVVTVMTTATAAAAIMTSAMRRARCPNSGRTAKCPGLVAATTPITNANASSATADPFGSCVAVYASTPATAYSSIWCAVAFNDGNRNRCADLDLVPCTIRPPSQNASAAVGGRRRHYRYSGDSVNERTSAADVQEEAGS